MIFPTPFPPLFLFLLKGLYSWVPLLVLELFSSSLRSPYFSLSSVALAANRSDWSSIADLDTPISQKHLSYAIDQATCSISCLLSSAICPIQSSSPLHLLPHAGDWLHVIPSSALGLHMLDWEFRLCLLYWLGVPLSQENWICPACSSNSDPYGDHMVSCGGNGDRIHRHNSLRDVMFSVAQSATLSPRKELPSLIPGCSSKPADVFLPYWTHGCPAALDVSVISPLQVLTVQGSAQVQGHALKVGEPRKRSAYDSMCRSAGVTLCPLLADTLGGWAQEAMSTLASIGSLQEKKFGLATGKCTRHLLQRLAITLWRSNASMWACHLEFPPSLTV